MHILVSLITLIGLAVPGVSAFAQAPTPESEPNDSLRTADTTALGATAEGRVASPRGGADTVDYWLVHAEAGETIYVALDGDCPTCIESGFQIQLLRANGQEPPAVHKSQMDADPQLSHVATTSGFYFVRVTRWANHAGSPGPSGYRLTFRERKCPDDPHEPNDSFAGAAPISLDVDLQGRWCPNGDRDLFRLSAAIGTVLEFWMDSVHEHGYHPAQIVLFDGDSVRRGNWEFYVSGTPPPSHHRFIVSGGGTFYLEPESWRGSLAYRYQLHVRSYGPPPRGLSVERAARELISTNPALTPEERSYLDHLGNKNGAYDLGDFQIFQQVMRR